MTMPLFMMRALDERPEGPLPHIHRAAVVPATVEDTFAFFADPANLERLTPPWLRFTISSARPLPVRHGTLIDYRIALRAVPMRWRSRIDVWQPGVCFVDRQILGPYLWWRHEHRFERVPAGTLVVDHVEYLPRLRVLSRRLVERDLARIFDYRGRALQDVFAARSGA